jgi:hypothetical protein
MNDKKKMQLLCEKLADMVKEGPDGQIVPPEAYEPEAREIMKLLGGKFAQEIPTMYFANPCFNDKINYTVRLGDKWGKLLTVGDKFNIALGHGGEAVIAEAEVADVVITRLGFIMHLHPRVYQYEHDPECCDLRGLLGTLEAHYEQFRGKSGHDQYYQIVSCIGFAATKRRESKNGQKQDNHISSEDPEKPV